MSDPVTALNGASFEGTIGVKELGPQGMIALRGDLSSAAIQNALSSVIGVDIPSVRQAQWRADRGMLWMSPDEILVLCPYAQVSQILAQINTALADEHILAVNVSDARASFELKGERTREVLAKLAPVDMSPGAFDIGDLRRTRLAQVAAAFWMVDNETARIICFRSVADYVFKLLSMSSEIGGEVDFF